MIGEPEISTEIQEIPNPNLRLCSTAITIDASYIQPPLNSFQV